VNISAIVLLLSKSRFLATIGMTFPVTGPERRTPVQYRLQMTHSRPARRQAPRFPEYAF